MSFWNIFDIFATSDKGETMTKVSDNVRVSSRGVTYTTMGNVTVGSDGSTFVQMGDFSSDGSTRLSQDTATGRGAVFNKPERDSFSDFGSSRNGNGGFGNDPW